MKRWYFRSATKEPLGSSKNDDPSHSTGSGQAVLRAGSDDPSTVLRAGSDNEKTKTQSGIYDYLFTVEEVNRRALAGMPFRDAYRSVGIEVNEGRFHYDHADLRHTHLGSIHNLCNDRIAQKMQQAASFVSAEAHG